MFLDNVISIPTTKSIRLEEYFVISNAIRLIEEYNQFEIGCCIKEHHAIVNESELLQEDVMDILKKIYRTIKEWVKDMIDLVVRVIRKNIERVIRVLALFIKPLRKYIGKMNLEELVSAPDISKGIEIVNRQMDELNRLFDRINAPIDFNKTDSVNKATEELISIIAEIEVKKPVQANDLVKDENRKIRVKEILRMSMELVDQVKKFEKEMPTPAKLNMLIDDTKKELKLVQTLPLDDELKQAVISYYRAKVKAIELMQRQLLSVNAFLNVVVTIVKRIAAQLRNRLPEYEDYKEYYEKIIKEKD